MRSGGSSYAWAYLYQGLRYDSVTGLYPARHRELHPAMGRPLQRDPLGFGAGDANVYRWEGNTPASVTDPMGLQYAPPIANTPNADVWRDDDERRAWEELRDAHQAEQARRNRNRVNVREGNILEDRNPKIYGPPGGPGMTAQDALAQAIHEMEEAAVEIGTDIAIGVATPIGVGVAGAGLVKGAKAIAKMRRAKKAAGLANNGSKRWQDFLPEAKERLARSKAEHGDGAIAMAISRKQALKRIEGLINAADPEKSIEAHIGKLTRPGSGPHIRIELNARIDEIRRLAQHTGSKSEAEIVKQLDEWVRRIVEIPDVAY